MIINHSSNNPLSNRGRRNFTITVMTLVFISNRQFEASHELSEHQWNMLFPIDVTNIVISQLSHQPHHVTLPRRIVVANFPDVHEVVEPKLVTHRVVLGWQIHRQEPVKLLHCRIHFSHFQRKQFRFEFVQNFTSGTQLKHKNEL